MSLFNELKRRNVFRVGLAYLVSAWVIAQVLSLVLDSIKAPDWVMQAILLLMGLGFIVALIIAWAYELTPEGIKKEKDVIRDDYLQLRREKIIKHNLAYWQKHGFPPQCRAKGKDDFECDLKVYGEE